MKASYYQVEGRKLNDFLVRRRNYQKHLERLRGISGKKVQPTLPDMLHSDAFNDFKERNRKFTREERRKEILEYNSKVFDRLVDISGRKPGSSFDVQHSKNQTAAFYLKDHHNSYYNQKEFFKKVNAENSTLVHRIMTQVSPLSHKKQEQEFMETRRLKQRLERFPFLKNLEKKLQALQSVSTEKVERAAAKGTEGKRYSTEHSKHPSYY